jgi:hypothetical protein
MPRALSDQFMSDLKDGYLRGLTERVRGDSTLDFQIRNNQVHIYYRGGKIFDVKPIKRGQAYQVFMAHSYLKKKDDIAQPSKEVRSEKDLAAWLELTPLFKGAMDHYLTVRASNSERAFQQTLSWENTYSRTAWETDYFILDIEYQTRLEEIETTTKFDLVAMRWDRTDEVRKNPDLHRPTLAICEMKYGDGALASQSGLLDHAKNTLAFFRDNKKVEAFRHEMFKVLNQKLALGIVKFNGRPQSKPIKELSTGKPEFIFIIANHKPTNQKLIDALESPKLQTVIKKIEDKGVRVKFARASFLGYGLYVKYMLGLDAFLKLLKQ